MSTQLPDSITTFFKVSNGSDVSALSQCFAEGAVVRDEGGLHQGHEAIETWLRDARRKYAYRGYLLLQQIDRRLLEGRLPAAVLYNLMVSARRPG